MTIVNPWFTSYLRHNMTFIFWQGIISIHQKAFLEAVAAHSRANKVLLVVAEDITEYRKSMGWEVPQLENVTLIQSPSVQEIRQLIADNKDAIHTIGGIKVGTMLSAAFEECIRAGCRIGIMTEPYNWAGAKGLLRTIKYKYYQLRYARHIQFILTIGMQGELQYESLGYKRDRIFPWAYFVDVPATNNVADTQANVRLIYAGRLEPAKGILRFLSEIVRHNTPNYIFDLYGAGVDEAAIRKVISDNNCENKVKIHPFLKHDELLQKYANYNWVVLPSTGKDGWGVIVSEGLLNGLKAICSNICGAGRVINSGANGVVFDWNKSGDCSAAISKMLDNTGFRQSHEIRAWAEKGISATAGADYFFKIIDHIYNNKGRPGIPWEEN